MWAWRDAVHSWRGARGRRRGGTGRGRGGEAGFSLVEVLVAFFVLLAVLVPVGDLLGTTSQVIANGTLRTQAQGIAQQEIAAVQAMADNCGDTADTQCDGGTGGFALPFTGFVPAGGSGVPAVAPTTVSGTTATWNTSSAWTARAETFTVGTQQYTAYVDASWCSAPTSGSSGSLGTSQVTSASGAGALEFVVAVSVVWDRTTLTSGYSSGTHVVATSVILPPAGWSGITFPTPAGALDGCPVGLA